MQYLQKNMESLLENLLDSNRTDFTQTKDEVFSTITSSTSSITILDKCLRMYNNTVQLKQDMLRGTEYKNFDSRYMVSTTGKVFDKHYWKYNTVSTDSVGYLRVTINGVQVLLHRLVYETFNGEIPEKMEVNHIDTNKSNPTLDNLELLTHKENCNSFLSLIHYRMGNRNKGGNFKKRKIVQATLDGKVVKVWESARDAYKEGGYYQNFVGLCAKGKKKSYKNFLWFYQDETTY